jgi:molybdenum cofactor cytidylyltransferase
MASISTIAPVILAAGDSTRMGYPKALLPLGADTFLTRILAVLRKNGLPAPIIVLGRSAAVIQPLIREWDAEVRINPDPDRGQLSSIQLALSCIRPEYDAGMIWPVDQPAVTEKLVRDLVRLFIDSGSRIACPAYRGRRGHPAIFHRELFREFMDAPLEEGPKKIILRHEQATALLPTEESAVVRDIDTPSGYEELTGETLKSALARRGIPLSIQ